MSQDSQTSQSGGPEVKIHASNSRGTVLIPGQGTISHMPCGKGQKKKKASHLLIKILEDFLPYPIQ